MSLFLLPLSPPFYSSPLPLPFSHLSTKLRTQGRMEEEVEVGEDKEEEFGGGMRATGEWEKQELEKEGLLRHGAPMG